MTNYIIFYAPFLVMFLSIIVAFWLGPKDKIVSKKEE